MMNRIKIQNATNRFPFYDDIHANV